MLPIVHHADYNAHVPAGHRFPMGKFKRLMEILRADGIAHENNTFTAEAAPASWLALAHDEDYVSQVLTVSVPRAIEREIGLPVNASVCERAQYATGGTVLTARLALKHGIAANTAGGSHHAKKAHGAGFCVFNDVAVAIKVLQAEGLAKRIVVVDLDVHQGDGTAEIFAGDDDVFTLSFHGEKNYPHRKKQSNLDIGLADGADDDTYLNKLKEVVPPLLDQGKPDLVFYNAGVDPHLDDQLGRLSLSDNGLVMRDRFVMREAQKRDIPVACVLGGGYMEDVDRLAARHSLLFRVATELTTFQTL